MINGADTFKNMEIEDMYYPILEKVNKMEKNMKKQFKAHKIRGFSIQYKKNNLFMYMKHLAFKRYQKQHLIKIIRKNNINIFSENDLNKIRRTKSHKLPYHQRAYHMLIYRNYGNYKYKPYLFPLNKEEKDEQNLLSYSERRMIRRKRQRIFINHELESKIRYLRKIKERLKLKSTSIKKIKIITKSKSSPNNSDLYNFSKLLKNNWNNQRKRLQGKNSNIFSEKTNINSTDNLTSMNSLYEESTTFKNNLLSSINVKKEQKIILPKINKECVTALKNLNQINKNLIQFKGINKQNAKNDEEKINDNNLLNLNLQQLYKLFYIKNKKRNRLKIIRPEKTLNIEQKTKYIEKQKSKEENS